MFLMILTFPSVLYMCSHIKNIIFFGPASLSPTLSLAQLMCCCFCFDESMQDPGRNLSGQCQGILRCRGEEGRGKHDCLKVLAFPPNLLFLWLSFSSSFVPYIAVCLSLSPSITWFFGWLSVVWWLLRFACLFHCFTRTGMLLSWAISMFLCLSLFLPMSLLLSASNISESWYLVHMVFALANSAA